MTLYSITFENNIIYNKGFKTLEDYLRNSGWITIPDKPIIQIVYLIQNKVYKFANYEAYNHLIEKVNIVGGQIFFTKIFLMGKKDGIVDRTIIDLRNNTITTDQKLFGQEYNNQPTTGWKQGILLKVI
jgi:hypothetical protein